MEENMEELLDQKVFKEKRFFGTDGCDPSCRCGSPTAVVSQSGG